MDGDVPETDIETHFGPLMVPGNDDDEIGFLLIPATDGERLATFSDRSGTTLARDRETKRLVETAADLVASLVPPSGASFGFDCRVVRSAGGTTIGAGQSLARIANAERQLNRLGGELIHTLRVWMSADLEPLNLADPLHRVAYYSPPLRPDASKLEKTWMLSSMVVGGEPSQLLPQLDELASEVDWVALSDTDPLKIARSIC